MTLVLSILFRLGRGAALGDGSCQCRQARPLPDQGGNAAMKFRKCRDKIRASRGPSIANNLGWECTHSARLGRLGTGVKAAFIPAHTWR
jgi:hypothetical protein